MVNYATNNETAKVTDTIYLARDIVMQREERLRRREQYHARRNRETAEACDKYCCSRKSKLEIALYSQHVTNVWLPILIKTGFHVNVVIMIVNFIDAQARS